MLKALYPPASMRLSHHHTLKAHGMGLGVHTAFRRSELRCPQSITKRPLSQLCIADTDVLGSAGFGQVIFVADSRTAVPARGLTSRSSRVMGLKRRDWAVLLTLIWRCGAERRAVGAPTERCYALDLRGRRKLTPCRDLKGPLTKIIKSQSKY